MQYSEFLQLVDPMPLPPARIADDQERPWLLAKLALARTLQRMQARTCREAKRQVEAVTSLFCFAAQLALCPLRGDRVHVFLSHVTLHTDSRSCAAPSPPRSPTPRQAEQIPAGADASAALDKMSQALRVHEARRHRASELLLPCRAVVRFAVVVALRPRVCA